MLSLYHLVALGLFAGFVLLDRFAAARAFPAIGGWRARAGIVTILYFAAATYAPLLWDDLLGAHSLYDASGLPLWLQIVGGLLLLELGIYAWHRTMHNVQPLWRWFHQMHHSAERVDIWGAFYFSPLDMIGWNFLTSLVLVFGFGISATAAIAIGIFLTFLAMFQHANLKTPRWIGYLVVRPESHAAHHERGVHAYNYCDLPLWDMLFGTFKNPKSWEGEAGFWDGASARLVPMLAGRELA